MVNACVTIYNYSIFMHVFSLILYVRATQLILTKVQRDKFGISRGPVKSLTCNNKNETIIISKYSKIFGFSVSRHTVH